MTSIIRDIGKSGKITDITTVIKSVPKPLNTKKKKKNSTSEMDFYFQITKIIRKTSRFTKKKKKTPKDNKRIKDKVLTNRHQG